MKDPMLSVVYRAIIHLVSRTRATTLRRLEATSSPLCVHAVDILVSPTTELAIHLHKTPSACK